MASTVVVFTLTAMESVGMPYTQDGAGTWDVPPGEANAWIRRRREAVDRTIAFGSFSQARCRGWHARCGVHDMRVLAEGLSVHNFDCRRRGRSAQRVSTVGRRRRDSVNA